jgi:hypothetical protein
MPKVVFVETKRGVLKCYTHFKRDRPDLSNDAIINRLMYGRWTNKTGTLKI